MPYIKGMVHEVDFRRLLTSVGITMIKDIWGNPHPVNEINLILTKSQLKGFGWLEESGYHWFKYIRVCEMYRRALCAWCCMPDKKKNATPNAEWQFKTCFAEYHEEFPELVNENGEGWYYRHVHAVADFISANRTKVNKHIHCLAERTKQWEDEWSNKVKQYQVPLFSSNTHAEWLLSFDSAIADALEFGALRCEAVTLTAEQTKRLELFKPKDVPMKVLTTLAEFYIANKQEQSEWVILPVTNIGAYLGSSSLGRQYLSKIPSELMERKQSSFGASAYKMYI